MMVPKANYPVQLPRRTLIPGPPILLSVVIHTEPPLHRTQSADPPVFSVPSQRGAHRPGAQAAAVRARPTRLAAQPESAMGETRGDDRDVPRNLDP